MFLYDKNQLFFVLYLTIRIGIIGWSTLGNSIGEQVHRTTNFINLNSYGISLKFIK